MKFEIGDRVRTTVDAKSLWLGGWEAPKGSAGAVTSVYRTAYGVLLDGDQYNLSVPYSKDELEAES